MDTVLRLVAAGGIVTTAFVLPNAAVMLEKPAMKLLDALDERARQRELRRVLYYMKQRGLIRVTARDYQNGLRLTPAGRQKLRQLTYDQLAIPRPDVWDGRWRLVFFDIPEEQKRSRNALSRKLRLLGMQQLQKSIWIHPFPCRAEVEMVTETLQVRQFVTYVEINAIDNEAVLRKRFTQLLA